MTDYDTFSITMAHGDTQRFRFTVKDRDTLEVVDISMWPEFWATAKIRLSDTDAEAVFVLTATGGGITIINATNGLAEVKIDPSNTNSLDYRKYNLFIDIQGIDGVGGVWTLARGTLTIVADVTRATS